jgi:hypothetical protein
MISIILLFLPATYNETSSRINGGSAKGNPREAMPSVHGRFTDHHVKTTAEPSTAHIARAFLHLGATVAVFLPPILMIIFLTPFYQRIKEGQWVRAVVQSILAALVGMLVLVTLQMGRAALSDWQSWAIMVGAVAALIGLRVDLLWVAPATAEVSLVLF